MTRDELAEAIQRLISTTEDLGIEDFGAGCGVLQQIDGTLLIRVWQLTTRPFCFGLKWRTWRELGQIEITPAGRVLFDVPTVLELGRRPRLLDAILQACDRYWSPRGGSQAHWAATLGRQ